MTNYLLSIAADAVKDNTYGWLIATSLPPALYYLNKKRKQKWLQTLFIKWVMKRAAKRIKKGKKMSDGVAILIVILAIVGIGALLVWLLGWTWAIVIVVLSLLLLTRKKGEPDYE
jgi:fatty acid desaturase